MPHPYLRRQFGRVNRQRYQALSELRLPQQPMRDPDWRAADFDAKQHFIDLLEQGHHPRMLVMAQTDKNLAYLLSDIAFHTDLILVRVNTPLWLRENASGAERALRRLLSEAEDAGQLLFFDEADSLLLAQNVMRWQQSFYQARCPVIFNCRWHSEKTMPFDACIG